MDTLNGSVLPVEIPDSEIPYTDEDEFDGKKHKSHLLNCKGLQSEWEKKKWKFIKQRIAFAKI